MNNACKAKVLVLAKVMWKGDDRNIAQSSNDFSKVAEQLLNKTGESYLTGRNFLKNINIF